MYFHIRRFDFSAGKSSGVTDNIDGRSVPLPGSGLSYAFEQAYTVLGPGTGTPK